MFRSHWKKKPKDKNKKHGKLNSGFLVKSPKINPRGNNVSCIYSTGSIQAANQDIQESLTDEN